MLTMTALIVLLAALPASAPVPRAVPQIPTPAFVEDARLPPKTPYDWEISFRPKAGHSLDEIHDFYSEWARREKWRQVSKAEESWSADEWFSYRDQNGREVRQRMATWVDQSGYWSLRFAARDYGSASWDRAFVFLTPFINIDKSY